MSSQSGVARIVFKEVKSGDYRKFEALSNDADTGGGARDLRFSPYEQFRGVFEHMFPREVEAGIREGELFWLPQGKAEEISQTVRFHAPTNSRGNEGRLGTVHKWIPKTPLPSSQQGRVFLLFIQNTDGKVWPYFTTEKSLREDPWHESISQEIIKCIGKRRNINHAIMGFRDFITGGCFCNGK